jgi:hypothetical protein
MQKVIRSMLEGKTENHILPFFWQHGESESILREMVAKIHEAHIGAVCVESRPHPDFLGESWWRDMDIIMDECKKRDVAVWILDDAKFPTGYAAGRVVRDFPEHRKWFLKETHIDVIGPASGTSFLLKVPAGDILYRVVASPRTGENDHVSGSFIDLTGCIADDQIYWEVPEGYWRIFYMTLSRVSGHSVRLDEYLNPLTAEGTQVLIDTVYEAHYQHYGDEFGKTFKGFFSDEPQMGNAYGYHASIGRVPYMSMPWCDELETMLKQSLGEEMSSLLPGLWYEIGENTWKVRYAYMDAMTRLYDKNFCTRIGDWCRAHGVEYIGHVIEENNCHGRLGNGTGHYFRSLWGQDMAGIDVVLHEIIPGIKGSSHAWTSRDFEADDEFFYYGLAKLCSSLAHIDPKKKGRAMCEIFGAYGWVEGLRQMKWLTDFMLVRGINCYVPHAFTPKEFPDPDCPPHFYARGKNPQYRDFFRLMDYMNRVSSLISGGTHVASAAVLYHAEGEWSGSEYMKSQTPVRVLAEEQIDCDILPIDTILSHTKLNDKKQLSVGNETYGALILPYMKAIPMSLVSALRELAGQGLPVFFVNGLPKQLTDKSADGSEDMESLLSGCEVIPLGQLAAKLRTLGIYDLTVTCSVPDLRIYHYRQGESDHYLLFNESVVYTQETELKLCDSRIPLRYDAYKNKLYSIPFTCANEENLLIPVKLAPYEGMVITLDGENASLSESGNIPAWRDALPEFHPIQPIGGKWSLSTASAEGYPSFTPYCTLEELKNLNASGMLPRFSGTIRYEAVFNGDAFSRGGPVQLDLGVVGETAHIWLNGEDMGTCISFPYRVSVDGKVQKGENRLVIDVTNTLVYEQHDRLSVFQPIPASGLIGPVGLRSELF